MKESEKIAGTESVEVAQHSCYYYRATIIQKLLQGEDVDLRHNPYCCVDFGEEVDGKFAFDSVAAKMVLERFLVMIDFINTLDEYRYISYYDVFCDFFDIDSGLVNFQVSDVLLAQMDELSASDSLQIRGKLSEYGGRYNKYQNSIEFHDSIQGILETHVSLGGTMQALGSAMGMLAARFLETLDTICEDKCRTIGAHLVETYNLARRELDLREYGEWLYKCDFYHLDTQLSKRMRYYIDKLYQTDYLKPYRGSIKPKRGRQRSIIYYGRYPYMNDAHGLLKSPIVPRHPHDLFLWKEQELLEVSILRNIFHNFQLDEVALGKLVLENRVYFSESMVMDVITSLEMHPILNAKLHEYLKKTDGIIPLNDLCFELRGVVVPNEMESDKAIRVWDEFAKEGYMVKDGDNYYWAHSKNREFGYFVHYAHVFFYKQHAKDEIINWYAYCDFFFQDISKIRSYRNGCSDIARIEKTSGKKKKLPKSALQIKKIFSSLG